MKPLANHFSPPLYPAEAEGEISLYDVAATLWRRRVTFAGVVLLGLLGSVLVTSIVPARYESAATLKLGRVLKDTTDGVPIAQSGELAVELEARFGKGGSPANGAVLERIEMPKQERKAMEAFLTLHVRAGSPAEAHDHLRTILEEVLAGHRRLYEAKLAQIGQRKAELMAYVADYAEQIGEIESRLASLRGDGLVQAPLLLLERSSLAQKIQQIEAQLPELEFAMNWSRATEVVVGPTLPEGPVSPRVAVFMALGAVASLFGALIAAFLVDFFAKFRHRLRVEEPVS